MSTVARDLNSRNGVTRVFILQRPLSISLSLRKKGGDLAVEDAGSRPDMVSIRELRQ